MTALGLLTCALATWRISVLLVDEQGPWKFIQRLRERIGITHQEDGKPISWPDGMLGSLFGCVWCLSVWVAPAVVIAWLWCPVVISIVAVAGAAVVMEELVRRRS